MKKLAFLLLLLSHGVFGQDLFVSEVVGPKSFKQYENLAVTVTVKNEGSVAITKRSYTNIYLSTDNALGNDQYMGFVDLNSLGANESITSTCSECSAITSPPGNYYLIFQVDRGGAITETNENNNIHIVDGYIVTAPDIDFVISQMSFDKMTVAQHDIIRPTYEVRNIGSTDASGDLFTTFYLSTDQTLEESDIDLAYYYNSLDGPDVVHNASWNEIIIPTVPAGTYYIIGRTDDIYGHTSYFNEINELNNTAVSSAVTIVNVVADLEVVAPMTASYLDGSGSSNLTVTYQLKNNGTSGISGYLLEYYLVSTEPPLRELIYSRKADHTSSYINPGETETQSEFIYFFPPTVPPAGTFKVEVQVNMNNGIPESDLTDNTLQSINTITIEEAPDPVITITNASFADTYDDRDTELSLQTIFKNDGEDDLYLVDQLYNVSIKNASQTVFTDLYSELFFLSVDETESINWALELDESLAAGDYTVEISCASGPCYTNAFSLPLTIKESPSITLTSATFDESYNNVDTQLSLNVNFSNSGNVDVSALTQIFNVSITNISDTAFSETKSSTLDIAVAGFAESEWQLSLPNPLEPGEYTVTIACSTGPCYTNPYELTLTIEEAIFILSGSITGEDNVPITSGELFLYKKDDDGLIEFVEKKNLVTNTFEFEIDTQPHTLYLIPDPVNFSQYVPTLFDKSLFIAENSYFSSTENANLAFKTIKLSSSPSGNRFIEGSVFEEGSPAGRLNGILPVQNLPIILLNSSFNAIAHTRTDDLGAYEFPSLEPGSYWILIAFEPDHQFSYSMPQIDLSEESASVKLDVTGGVLQHEIIGIPDEVVTGLPEATDVSVQTYPNPFQERLVIDNKSCFTSMAVHDITGRNVANLTIKCGINELNTTSFSKGIYILKFIDDRGKSVSQKIIKF